MLRLLVASVFFFSSCSDQLLPEQKKKEEDAAETNQQSEDQTKQKQGERHNMDITDEEYALAPVDYCQMKVTCDERHRAHVNKEPLKSACIDPAKVCDDAPHVYADFCADKEANLYVMEVGCIW